MGPIILKHIRRNPQNSIGNYLGPYSTGVHARAKGLEESGRISVQHLRVSQHTRWPSLVSILHAKGADGPSKRSAQNTSLTFACGISNWVVGLSPNQGVLTILAVLATVSKLRPVILACGLRSQHSGDQGSRKLQD